LHHPHQRRLLGSFGNTSGCIDDHLNIESSGLRGETRVLDYDFGCYAADKERLSASILDGGARWGVKK
jgi:hypothetical protein